MKFPKGVIGYAVCDLLRVILTQSADQMSTGTCSYVASLAALTRASAARTGANPVGSVTLISRGTVDRCQQMKWMSVQGFSFFEVCGGL